MSGRSKGPDQLRRVAARVRRMPRTLKQAAGRAVATAARQGRTAMIRAVRDEVALPARYVQGKVFCRSSGADTWEIGAPKQAQGIPVVMYPHRAIPGGRRGKGITVQQRPGEWTPMPSAFRVRRAGARGRAKGAFRFQTRRGPLVFERAPGASRLPITAVKGQSVGQVFTEVAPDVAPEIQSTAAREFRRQVRLISEGKR